MEAMRESHRAFVQDQRDNGENLGLRLNKLNEKIDEQGSHEEKDKMLDALVSYTLKGEQFESYQYVYKQWKKAQENTSETLIFEIEASTKCLLGIGNASIHEFGVNLNFPYGVPYISGSSLKGLLSSYFARHYGDDWSRNSANSQKSDYQVELFGGDRTENEKLKSYVGSVIFHDAWLIPQKDNWFVKDIINVHHQKYYAGERLPDGIENPIPIKLAALKPNIKFMVSIQCSEDITELLLTVLEKALKEEGLGAKTATGYGRFKLRKSIDQIFVEQNQIKQEKTQQKQEEEQKELFNMLSEEEKVLSKLKENSKQLSEADNKQLQDDTDANIKKAEELSNDWSIDYKNSLADIMFDYFEITGWHQSGKKTKKQKDKQKQKKLDRINKLKIK